MAKPEKLHPAIRFRGIVESKATEFLQGMVGSDAGNEAAGRVALAFRQAAQADDKLYSCDPASVAQAVALSAITGLMPGGPLPDVYLLPRGNQLQWQVSHRGFARLASRAGIRLRTKAVFESDEFNVREGTDPELRHVPDLNADQSWDTLRAVYVVAHYPNGDRDFVVIRKADIEKRRANSDSFRRSGQRSVWGKWPIEMALKTGIRYAIARGLVPMDDDSSTAYQHDGEQDAPSASSQIIDATEVKDSDTGMSALKGAVKELTVNEIPDETADLASEVDTIGVEPESGSKKNGRT
tara:strand:- start:1202 stop:2089 length:888 start_codon:yes stop_codon:yes gene_type:complete